MFAFVQLTKLLHKFCACWRYEHFTERNFHFSWSDFVAWSRNLWTTQMPCNNDNYSEYMVHGTQNDQLEPSVSTQKSILINIHRLKAWPIFYRPLVVKEIFLCVKFNFCCSKFKGDCNPYTCKKKSIISFIHKFLSLKNLVTCYQS